MALLEYPLRFSRNLKANGVFISALPSILLGIGNCIINMELRILNSESYSLMPYVRRYVFEGRASQPTLQASKSFIRKTVKEILGSDAVNK